MAKVLRHKQRSKLQQGVVRSDARPLLGLVAGGSFLALDESVDTIYRPLVVDSSPNTSFFTSPLLAGFAGGVGPLRGSQLALVEGLLEPTNAVEFSDDGAHFLSLSDFGLSESGDSYQFPLLAAYGPAGKTEVPASSSPGSGSEAVSPEAAPEPNPTEGGSDSSSEQTDQTAALGEDKSKGEECVTDTGDEDCVAIADQDDSSGLGSVGAAGGGLPLASLGGGGGSGAFAGSSGGGSVGASLSGAVIDGYVEGSTVFADLNGDGIWNTGEPTAITDASGAYTLEAAGYDLSQYSIIATGGTDVTTGAAVDILIAPAGVNYVTPISAIAYYAGGDATSVLSGLGFSYDDMLVDPAAAETYNEDFLVAGASILTAVSSSASLLAEASGDSAADVSASIFQQLASQETANLKLLTDRTDSDSDPSSFLESVLAQTVAARGMTVDSDVLTSASQSIGSIVKELRTAESLSDVQVAASIGQALLKEDMKTVGEAIRNGDSDITTLMDGIKSNYQDSFENLKAAQQSALKGRNSGIDGLTVNKDIFGITLADTGEVDSFTLPDGTIVTTSLIKDRAVFESSGGVTHVLLENDSIDVSLTASLYESVPGTILTPISASSDGIVITPTTSGLGFEVAFDPTFFAFDLTEADFAGSFDPVGDLLVLLNAATAKYGDYYFEYQVAVEGESTPATGLVTLQIAPDVEIDLKDTFTVSEDQLIMLADLVNTRTFGPGDQMVLDGLPVGTIVSLPMVGDPINGDETLSYTASGTAPVTIPTEWMLPWRFDDITITLPENFSGQIDLKASLVAQYESATARDKDTMTIDVDAVADGVSVANSATLGVLAQKAIGTDRLFVDGEIADLFGSSEPSNIVSVIRAGVFDSSEVAALAIGLRPGIDLIGHTADPDPAGMGLDASYSWYLFNDQSGDLTKQLAGLQIRVTDSALTEVAVLTTFGSVETETPDSVTFGAVKTITAGTVAPAVVSMVFADATADPLDLATNIASLTSGSNDFAGTFSINISDVIPQALQSQDLPPDQLVSVEVAFPRFSSSPTSGYAVVPVSGKTNWTHVGYDGVNVIYEIRDATVEALYNGSIAPLTLRPASGYTSQVAGDTVLFSAETYTQAQPNERVSIDSVYGTSSTINLKVPPDIDVGLVGTQASAIRLSETQGNADDNWVSLNQFLALDASSISSVANSTTTLHLEFTDTTGLGGSPVEIRSADVSLTPTVDGDVYGFTVDLADVSTLDGIEIRGVPYLDLTSGEVEASFHLSVTVAGYDPQVGESTTIKTLIEAQASGVDPGFAPVTDYQSTEDTAFALQDLIDSAAVLKDVDGSETLSYIFRLPTEVYLQAAGPMMGGRVDAGERVFEIAASDVDLYTVVPADSFAASGLSFSITPVAVDANGDRFAGNPVSGSFDIAGVSEAPTLAVTSGVSGLIDGTTTTELAVPVVVARTDTDETLSVTLSLSAPQGVDHVELFVDGTKQQLTNGSVTLTDMAVIKKLSTLTVTSTDDYRGSNALSLTVTASSQDGSDTPAVVSETTSIEMYQPVQWLDAGSEREGSVALSKTSGSQSLTFTVEMPTQPDTLGPADVALLVTGVPGDTYFSDGAIPVGASLGGGVWLFTGAEVFGTGSSLGSYDNLIGSIQVNGTDLFTPSVKAIFTDAVGGTSASASSGEDVNGNLFQYNPQDPVVIAFDADPGLMDLTSSPVPFDFVSNSLVGLEDAPYWFTGDYTGGTPTGTAFVVRGDTVTSYNDLYPSLDALIADPDLADASVWFDSDTSGTLGAVDEGELVLASSVVDLTALVTGDISPIDLDYDTQFATAITTDVTVVDSVSLTYGTGQSATAYGMVLPYDSDASPEATLMVASSVDEDAPIQVDINYTPINPKPAGTVVDLVKIYGVPENAMLSGAVRVEDDAGLTDYWIATIADGSQQTTTSLTLKFNTQHETRGFSLSAQPLVSVTDTTDPLNPVVETVFGRVSTEQQVTITARAETDLMIGRDSEGAISVLEGTSMNPADLLLSDIGLSVSSPDVIEEQYVAMSVTRDVDGFVVPDLMAGAAPYLVNLDGTAYTSGQILDNNGTAVFAIPEADLAKVALRLPELSTHAYTLSFYPISEHNGDFAFDSGNVLEVPVTVQAVAQGAENPTQQFTDDQDVTASIFTEGDVVKLQLAANRIDATETLVFRVTVTDPGATDFTKLTTIGGVAPTTITGNQATYEFAFAAGETIPAMEMVMDANFSGTLAISTEVATVDPVSGDQSVFGSPVDSVITLEGNPGNNGESFDVAIRKDGAAVSRLEIAEGQDLTFTVRVTSFDPDESFALTDSLSNPDITITGPIASTNASGVAVYDFDITYTGVPEISVLDGLKLTISEGSVSPVTTALNPIPMLVDPSAQGVEFKLAPIVSADAAIADIANYSAIPLLEGQRAYLHTNAVAKDPNEILLYKVKLIGAALENALTSIGDIHLDSASRSDYWNDSGNYFEFSFDGSEASFSDPIELVFDRYFDGDFEVEVGVASSEPRASDPASANALSDYRTHDEQLYSSTSPNGSEIQVNVVGDPGNFDGIGMSQVVFDLAQTLTVDQLTDLDSVLVGGSRLSTNLLNSVDGFSDLSSLISGTGDYLEFSSDTDIITLNYEPIFDGDVKLAIRTKDGNIVEVSSATTTVQTPLSFEIHVKQAGSIVEQIDASEGSDVDFTVQIKSYDSTEGFELTSTSPALTGETGVSGFRVVNNPTDDGYRLLEADLTYASVSDTLTGLDDLTLKIVEGSQDRELTLDFVPFVVDPISNGVRSVDSPSVSADITGVDLVLLEGQPAYLRPNLEAVDPNETLIYTVELTGLSSALQNGLISLAYMSATEATWDATKNSYIFEFSANDPRRFDELGNDLLSDPMLMRFEPSFNETFDVEVSARSLETRSSVLDTSPSVSAGAVPVVMEPLPGNDLGRFDGSLREVNTVTFDLLQELTVDQRLTIDKLLVGGSLYELGLFDSATHPSSTSSDGQYKEFVYDEDGDGADLSSLTVNFEPEFAGDVQLKIQTKDGDIVDVTAKPLTSLLSFDYEFLQDGSPVSVLGFTPEEGLNYTLRINTRDPDETVVLRQNGAIVTSVNSSETPAGSYDYPFAYKDLAEVGALSVDGLEIEINEPGAAVAETFQIPEIEIQQNVAGYIFEVPSEGYSDLLLAEAVPLDGIFSSRSGLISEYILKTSDPDLLGSDRGIIIKDGNGSRLPVLDDNNGFRAYHLTPAQANLATITLAATATLFSNTAQAQLIWEALAVDGSEIQAGGVQIDLRESAQLLDIISVDGSESPFFVVEGDSVHVDVKWESRSSDLTHVVVSGVEYPEGVVSVNVTAESYHVLRVDDPTTSYNELSLVSYQSASGPNVLHGMPFLTSADIFVLPDVASWGATAAGSVTPEEIFEDGYFGDMLAGEEFVFIDDAFGSLASNADGTAVSLETVGFSKNTQSLAGDDLSRDEADFNSDGEIPETLVKIHGTEANDLIVSNSVEGATLYGFGGTNELIGNVGNDHLIAGAGLDLLKGNRGDDVYQIAVDARASELNNEHRMDEMLSTLFGESEVTSFKDVLLSELSSQGISLKDGHEFSAFVADYSFKTEVDSGDDSDYMVFTNGSDKQIDLEYHAFSHTWGSGETDSFVYVLAKEFDADPASGIPDLYTSVLAQLAPSDFSYIDQINDGTYDIGITTA